MIAVVNELSVRQPLLRQNHLADLLLLRRVAVALVILALGLLLALAPVEMSLLLLLAFGLCIAIVLEPSAGLCLLLLILPFSQTRQITMAGVRVGAAEILLALTLCAWLARMAARQEIRLPSAPLALPLLAFMAVQLLSLPASPSFREGLPELVKWLEMLLLYLLVVGHVRPTHVPWLLGSALLAGTLQALLGAYQFLGGIGPEPFVIMGRFVRAYGTYSQPNPYAGYLGLVTPLALSVAVWATGRSWSQMVCGRRPLARQLLHHGPKAIFLVGITALMVVAMGMSWSRGAWLGLAASSVVVCTLRSRRTTLLLLLVATLVGAAATLSGLAPAPNAVLERLTDLGDHVRYAVGGDISRVEVTDANFAVLERVAHWQAAWRMFAARPWLGVGIGNYAAAYPTFAVPRWADPLGHAHNIYLHFLAETGLLGLTAYLVLFAAAAVKVWRARTASRGFSRALAIGVLAMLAHLAVHSLVDNLYVQGTYLHIAAVLGIVHVAAFGEPGRQAAAARSDRHLTAPDPLREPVSGDPADHNSARAGG